MRTILSDHWIAPEGTCLPDFIICGAMKCGTSTVHALLDSHPRIFIPQPEIHFFDMDDIFQHNDFFFYNENHWYCPDISSNPAAYWNWYSDFFCDAPRGSIIGEDSTCYLPSQKALFRISLQKKPIKIIICLRHPVTRSYSQYWHMLRTGRALFSFEDTLKYAPHEVLGRSMFLPQIQRVLKHIPRNQVFFFILEKYLSDKKTIAQQLLEFVGAAFDELSENVLQVHANEGKYPNYPWLQALKNRMFRGYGSLLYQDKLPYKTPVHTKIPFGYRLLDGLHTMINPLSQTERPRINPHTKKFLNQFFTRELEGINELIGENVTDLWFPG